MLYCFCPSLSVSVYLCLFLSIFVCHCRSLFYLSLSLIPFSLISQVCVHSAHHGIVPVSFYTHLRWRHVGTRFVEVKTWENKARYTTTEVACGWVGAIFEVTRSFGQEQCGQRNRIIGISKCDQLTDQPTNRPTNQRTDRASYRGAMAHLKMRDRKFVRLCNARLMIPRATKPVVLAQ